MAAAPVEPIDVLGVELIRAFKGIGERSFMPWCHNKMDMIGHQTVTVHDQLETLCSLGQQGQEHPPVIIYEEDVLTVIAPLSNMMGTTCNHNS